jgi:RNA polymerase sigma-70 factor (ECF subfamily)
MRPQDRGLDPDDIAQEAALRLWRALERERNITHLASYVYRVAVTATLDAFRRRRATREIDLGIGDDLQPAVMEATATRQPPADSPERAASTAELYERLERCLLRVAEPRRAAVRLHLQGFTTHEIAELSGFTEAKARNLAYRGLEDLRRHLGDEGIEGIDDGD